MGRLKSALLSLSAAALLAAPASAQIGGQPWELSGGAGWFSPDARTRVKDGPAYKAAFGWRMSQGFTLEAAGLWAPGVSDLYPGEPAVNFSTIGLDGRWNLRPAESHAVPYFIAGMAYGLSHSDGLDPAKLERGAPSAGLGLLLNAFNQRTYVRLEARDIWFRDRNAVEFSNDYAVTAGLQYVMGGKERDQDLDGVRDRLDKCPNTPIGARVDATGCPKDSDGDGVFDGLDKCELTPRGATVNKDGCPSDADGDLVFDGLDQCADTPKGATVDARGCPTDSDGDGVFDGIDQCPNTGAGCTVDATGCPNDADADGVCDGLDKCPNTSPGLKVDADGCPILVNEKETELLDTGMIRLNDINFETAKADILPESFPTLNVVGALLLRWPQLRMEIGGHTDARGSVKYNQGLSEARAGSVMNYLIARFPDLKAEQYTAKGYGELKPIAPNNNDLNMAKNRRVEFVVQNRDVLKKEVERRRLLQKDEAIPPMTPAPADTTKR